MRLAVTRTNYALPGPQEPWTETAGTFLQLQFPRPAFIPPSMDQVRALQRQTERAPVAAITSAHCIWGEYCSEPPVLHGMCLRHAAILADTSLAGIHHPCMEVRCTSAALPDSILCADHHAEALADGTDSSYLLRRARFNQLLLRMGAAGRAPCMAPGCGAMSHFYGPEAACSAADRDRSGTTYYCMEHQPLPLYRPAGPALHVIYAAWRQQVVNAQEWAQLGVAPLPSLRAERANTLLVTWVPGASGWHMQHEMGTSSLGDLPVDLTCVPARSERTQAILWSKLAGHLAAFSTVKADGTPPRWYAVIWVEHGRLCSAASVEIPRTSDGVLYAKLLLCTTPVPVPLAGAEPTVVRLQESAGDVPSVASLCSRAAADAPGTLPAPAPSAQSPDGCYALAAPVDLVSTSMNAFTDARSTWTTGPDQAPRYTRGRIQISAHPAADGMGSLTQEQQDLAREIVNRLDERLFSTFFLALAAWFRVVGSGAREPVRIHVNTLLTMRGDRLNGHGSYPVKAKRELLEDLLSFNDLWIHGPQPTYHRGRRLVSMMHSPLLEVVCEESGAAPGRYPSYRVLLAPGAWIEPLLAGTPQIAWISRHALALNGHSRAGRLGFRIALYLAFQWRIRAATANYQQPFFVSTLLNRIAVSVPEHRELRRRLRADFEQALTIMQQRGISGQWHYVDAVSLVFAEWLAHARVVIAPNQALLDVYSTIAVRARRAAEGRPRLAVLRGSGAR